MEESPFPFEGIYYLLRVSRETVNQALIPVAAAPLPTAIEPEAWPNQSFWTLQILRVLRVLRVRAASQSESWHRHEMNVSHSRGTAIRNSLADATNWLFAGS